MFNLFSKPKASVTVGIQLTSTYISVLVLDYSDEHNPVIQDYVNYYVGQYPSAESLTAKVKDYIEEHKLKKAYCCLVLDDADYQLLSVEPPKVPQEEMAEAVKWKIKDLIQYPISEAVVDIFSHPEVPGVHRDIVDVVVSPKEIIDKKAAFIEAIGLNLVAVDIPEFSYRNYIESTTHAESNLALVLLKPSHGKLVVINKGSVCFSRSFVVNYNGGLFDDIPENDIVLELQRSLDYYERQMKQVMPAVVVFAGENLIDDKVTEVTKESFNQKVLVETVSGFNFDEEDSLASSRLMATYGASLRRGLLDGMPVGGVL